MFVLCFSETDVRTTAREQLFPDWENACELNSESSNNTSPTNLCSKASVLFSHSELKAQLGEITASEVRVDAEKKNHPT